MLNASFEYVEASSTALGIFNMGKIVRGVDLNRNAICISRLLSQASNTYLKVFSKMFTSLWDVHTHTVID